MVLDKMRYDCNDFVFLKVFASFGRCLTALLYLMPLYFVTASSSFSEYTLSLWLQ